MPWGWYLGWTVMWELIGLVAVLALAWSLRDGGERGRETRHETNGIAWTPAGP
jgi:hypothetical protein